MLAGILQVYQKQKCESYISYLNSIKIDEIILTDHDRVDTDI